MRLNRREFVAAGAALLPIVGGRTVSAQGTRKLFLVAHGLSIIAVDRAAGQSGLPTTADRVDLLFVKNAAHEAPVFFVDSSSMVLDDCELQVLTGGAQLASAGVKLLQHATDPCPKGDQWLSMTLIPDFEKVFNMPGKIGLDPNCLDRKTPKLVRSRMSFRSGTLAGGRPRYTNFSAGERWQFPGNTTYISAFTDRLEWEVDVPAKQVLTFQSVEFATGKVKDTITIPAGTSDIVAGFIASPTKPQSNTTSIPHFDHYYDLLTGVPSRPIPQSATRATCVGTIFTVDQLKFDAAFDKLQQRFVKPMQQFDDRDFGGCANGEGAVIRRSDPGICISGIVYTDFP